MNESAPPATRPFVSRLARYLPGAVIVYLVLCGLVALAVPLAIQYLALDRIGESIGRQVSIERTRFNPFKLTLAAQGVRVAGQDPADDFLTIEEVFADLSISSIWHLAPVIDALAIRRPVVNLQRSAPGRFNFSDIVDRLGAAPSEPDSATRDEPPRFALHNLELTGGEVQFDDRVLDRMHRVSGLQVGVPLISNLDDAAAVPVQPALFAFVNGSPLSLAGTSLPFSENRETSVHAVLKDLEIATYLPMSPVALGFTVPQGRLSTTLELRFAQEAGDSRLAITGSAQVDDLRIDARDGPKLVQAKRIDLGLAAVEPLANRYLFGDLVIDEPVIDIVRAPDGQLPLVRAFTVQKKARETDEASTGTGTAAAAASDESDRSGKRDSERESNAAAKAQPVQWSLRKTTLRGGRVVFRDETVEPAVALAHTDIGIDIAEIGNRQAAPAAARLSLKQGEASRLAWEGEVDLAGARAGGHLEASVASIAPYLPYIGTALAARLQTGALAFAGDLEMGWVDGFSLSVDEAEASAESASLTLPQENKPAVSIARLAVEGVAVSLVERTVTATRASLSGADIRVERDAQGGLNLQRLAGSPADGGNSATDDADADEADDADGADGADGADADDAKRPWQVKIDRLDLDGNQLAWRDLGTPKPVDLPITQLAGSVGPLGTDLAAKSSVDLKARLGSAGSIGARGSLAIEPLSLQLDLQLQRLALAGFDPYLAEKLALGIEEGTLDTSGKLRYEGGRVAYTGSLQVAGLRSRERESDIETIRWKRLLLDDIDVDVDPAQLGPDDRIAIGGVTLSDFFARVLLSEEGRFNLQDIVRNEPSAPPPTSDSRPAATPSEGTSADAAAAGGGAKGRPDAGPRIRLGPIKLEQGRSNFTDRFIKPNYSVNLTDLNGGLSALASDQRQPADVALAGRVDGNAPIDISGKLDPLGASLFADIRAKADGIDLPTLTPYSAKYVGYEIEKGKLSLDVHYHIENERLQAQNRIVLDQLTLGEKVESPDATSLPIQFALGLLKNRNGEINVSLPIEGSLDDPQFSIGSVIANAIGNLLTRIVTAPFSALASAFGGGKEELSFVDFEPGSTRLTQESVKRLEIIAKALIERPALALEIAGRVDPKAEADAIRRERLAARLRALKRRQADGADPEAGAPQAGASQDGEARARQERQEEAATAAGVTVTPEEYPALLQRLYEETDFPDKPRDSRSSAKPLEVAELEKALMGAIVVDADSARRLGTRRAQVVQRRLAAQGKVPEGRMFVLAPRIDPKAAGPNRSRPQCTASCAEFSLR